MQGYTFHKLALDILGKATGSKPSICDKTDALFVQVFHKLLENKQFSKNIVRYFIDYQEENEDDGEARKNERRNFLSELKKSLIKVPYPDMDGNPVYVRSEQEKKICFVLSSLGLQFRYEEPYEYSLEDENHSQYRPDFSIHYQVNGVEKRIYLEHFGVDEHSLVPTWFAKDKNMTYDEANKKYNDGITWKKAAHNKFRTKLITTSSADFYYLDIKAKLQELLVHEGVPIFERSEDELYGMVLPPNSKQEKAFIRLIITFVTLMKSSCQSVNSIIKKAEQADDERSAFIVKNIFAPVYELYTATLKEKNEIDFTDVILLATEVCRKGFPISYEYIIVDEFQDISVDRYHFLKVLREGEIYSKLYCVGDDWQSIYRFSGSDMSLFSKFSTYFGITEINKIETTYRFGQPLVSLSATFIQRNSSQIKKNIHPFNPNLKTQLLFYPYDRNHYCETITRMVANIPNDKSIFLLGRYLFDDYYLSFAFQSVKKGNKFYYVICGREIEFLTVHKSKGLEADYVILLQCNKDTYGFPSLINDDSVLNYVLTESDEYPYSEERRLFYVAITRAKIQTMVMYDQRFPSAFVNEILHPEEKSDTDYILHRNANKRWTRKADNFLLQLDKEGRSIQYISNKMGRSQLSIKYRLEKLKSN